MLTVFPLALIVLNVYINNYVLIHMKNPTPVFLHCIALGVFSSVI